MYRRNKVILKEDDLNKFVESLQGKNTEEILNILSEKLDIDIQKEFQVTEEFKSKWFNKWLYYEGYESGSSIIYIKDIRIGRYDYDYSFTGYHIDFQTVDTETEMNGSLFSQLGQEVYFSNVRSINNFETLEELEEELSGFKEITFEEVKTKVKDNYDYFLKEIERDLKK